LGARVRVVVNPIAGAGLGTWVLPILVRRLARLGFTSEVVRTLSAEDARQAAGEVDESYHAVVAVGGDGTVREVISGLSREDVPVGVVPMGTANVLARELRLPFEPERAARVIAARHVRRLDLARANGRPFLLVAGVGLDAEVTRRVHASRRGAITILNYLPALLAEVVWFRTPALRVAVDGRPLNREGQYVVISNTRHFGGLLVMALDAVPDDGRLDVCVYRLPRRHAVLGLMVRFLTHRRPDARRATFVQGRRIEVTSSERVLYQLDGDPAGVLPLTIDLAPRAVSVIVPPPRR
jgi:diacylglycerol kinase (ATP)